MSRLAQQINQAWLRRGPLACLLWPLSLLMGALVALRRLGYRQGWLGRVRLPVPVLVVGNRVAGGAGKTPTTIALLQHLQAQGWRPGVLSRGYKARRTGDAPLLIDTHSGPTLPAHDTGDEPLLIWLRTGAPVMVGRDRAAGGLALLRAHPEVNVLVCDDGLQHLRLQRDIELIVFDQRGAGNGWLLPAGPLREPILSPPTPGLCAAPIVVYNAPQPSTALPGHLLRAQARPLCLLEDWWQGRPSAAPLQADHTTNRAVWALAGIAHPQRFFDTLRQRGFAPTTVALDDHADMATLPWPDGPIDLIVTEKDAVKLPLARVQRERPATRVWVAALDLHADAALWAELDAALQHLPPHSSSPGERPPPTLTPKQDGHTTH